jgi:hypothetical protein
MLSQRSVASEASHVKRRKHRYPNAFGMKSFIRIASLERNEMSVYAILEKV